jgi:threonine dehydrogenase-like Zn-dependent dehydrogenase
MRAVCWMGKTDLEVQNVPDPQILNPRDAIVKVTLSAICGSDLHLYGGFMPGMKKGDILGHEFMGEIVEVGSGCRKVKVGDRVVVPFNIACGVCWFCKKDEFSLCQNTNPAPSAALLEATYGSTGGGLFGYTHLYGGYSGGQAELVRVPFADIGCLPVNGHFEEQVLFLSDIFPTGYMAAENCNLQPGSTVAVFGCGPVGQFAIRSAFLLGAARVIAIDSVSERLQMARDGGAETLDDSEGHVVERIKDATSGRGADAVIDAVGLEAHGHGIVGAYDKAKQMVRLQTDRPTALRQAILACRGGGTVSIPGVYGGLVDKFPIGAAFGKGLTFKMGQTHTHRYMRPLLQRIEKGEIDPSFVITHRLSLDEVPGAYATFRDKEEGCIKVVIKPGTKATIRA